jgi:hypothetical protein
MPHRVSPNERIRATTSTSYSPRASSCRRFWKMSPGSTHPASYGHAPPATARTATPLRMSAPSPNITMNWNHARPFYTGFRTPPEVTVLSR